MNPVRKLDFFTYKVTKTKNLKLLRGIVSPTFYYLLRSLTQQNIPVGLLVTNHLELHSLKLAAKAHQTSLEKTYSFLVGRFRPILRGKHLSLGSMESMVYLRIHDKHKIQKYTPPKSNMDTKHDIFFNVSPFKYGVILGIQPLVFGGVHVNRIQMMHLHG